MKRTILTSILILFSLSLFSQVRLDSAGYKAYRATITKGNKEQTGASELLLYFSVNTVILNLPASNQTHLIHFNTKTIVDRVINGIKTRTVQCIDAGGFHCLLSIGYEEETDVYLIFIQYNNVSYFLECHKTDERPWDNDPKELSAEEWEPWTSKQI
jgi:hypothetical protein